MVEDKWSKLIQMGIDRLKYAGSKSPRVTSGTVVSRTTNEKFYLKACPDVHQTVLYFDSEKDGFIL